MSFPLIFIELLLSHIIPFTLTIVANLLVLAHAYHVACLLCTSKCFYRWICPFVLLVPSWKTSQHNVPKFALANFCLPPLRSLLSHLWWSWCLFWSTGSRASIASLNQLRCLLLSVPYVILPTSVKAEQMATFFLGLLVHFVFQYFWPHFEKPNLSHKNWNLTFGTGYLYLRWVHW